MKTQKIYIINVEWHDNGGNEYNRCVLNECYSDKKEAIEKAEQKFYEEIEELDTAQPFQEIDMENGYFYQGDHRFQEEEFSTVVWVQELELNQNEKL